jgi:hypothetical protein
MMVELLRSWPINVFTFDKQLPGDRDLLHIDAIPTCQVGIT